jgi:ABC-type glutathione transport system ATPase component
MDADTVDPAALNNVNREVLVSVTNMKKHFPIMKGIFRRQVGAVRAVDGISFDIYRGETLGLVGESGSGKSTTGRVILQLDEATEGTVIFDDTELTETRGEDLRRLRPRMQMIFQNPHASLNPRMTVGDIIGEPLKEHKRSGIPTSSLAASDNASVSPAPSPSTPISLSVTNPSLPWTFRSRHRWSISWKNFRMSLG